MQHTQLKLIDWAGFNVPTKHITGHIADSFMGHVTQKNRFKALKEVVVLRIRIQSHQAQLIMLQ